MNDPDQWELYCHSVLQEFNPKKYTGNAVAACDCKKFLATQKPNLVSPTFVSSKE